MPVAIAYIHGVNTPPFIACLRVACHPPAKPTERLNRGHVHHGRDKPFRVAAPCLTTGNGAAPIGGDDAVIAAQQKAAAYRKNILKRISTITAELQHATIETEIGV